MRKIVKIPSSGLSSTRRWMETFDVEPGILGSILRIMEEKGKTLSVRDKITIISFDAFHLFPKFCIDRKKKHHWTSQGLSSCNGSWFVQEVGASPVL